MPTKNRIGLVLLRRDEVALATVGDIVDAIETSQGSIACMLVGPNRTTMFVCTGQAQTMDAQVGCIEAIQLSDKGLWYPLYLLFVAIAK